LLVMLNVGLLLLFAYHDTDKRALHEKAAHTRIVYRPVTK